MGAAQWGLQTQLPAAGALTDPLQDQMSCQQAFDWKSHGPGR